MTLFGILSIIAQKLQVGLRTRHDQCARDNITLLITFRHSLNYDARILKKSFRQLSLKMIQSVSERSLQPEAISCRISNVVSVGPL